MCYNSCMKTRYKITAKAYDKRGRLVSTGENSYKKTHPIQAHFAKLAGEDYKTKLHAEISAILRAGDKRIHRIEIFRFDKNGNRVNAMPCRTCQKAIEAYKIKEVCYTV